MRDYRNVNEFIAKKQESEAKIQRLADEANAMNAKQDQASIDFITKQDANKIDQNARFMQEYRDVNSKINKTAEDQAYLNSRKAEFDAMNAKQDQASIDFATKQDMK